MKPGAIFQWTMAVCLMAVVVLIAGGMMMEGTYRGRQSSQTLGLAPPAGGHTISLSGNPWFVAEDGTPLPRVVDRIIAWPGVDVGYCDDLTIMLQGVGADAPRRVVLSVESDDCENGDTYEEVLYGVKAAEGRGASTTGFYWYFYKLGTITWTFGDMEPSQDAVPGAPRTVTWTTTGVAEARYGSEFVEFDDDGDANHAQFSGAFLSIMDTGEFSAIVRVPSVAGADAGRVASVRPMKELWR